MSLKYPKPQRATPLSSFLRLIPTMAAGCILFSCCLPATILHAADSPDFGTQIRPILAKHCFTCHGPDPDAREADLRLDLEAPAKEDRGGYAAIKAGDPAASELIIRVGTEDADMRMPPAESHPPLSDSEVDLLRRWVADGGKYETHWAFVAPTRPNIPAVSNADWCNGPIDQFVLSRVEQSGLELQPRADRATLIRRVYMDLTGTTPDPERVDRFVQDEDPHAYRKVVDELLASADYAERFARPWLDLARYSDTNGYEKDRPRSIWPYRDWVIRSIAEDMPFDQFSIEQLAGDMLPGATNQQRIATGFHRNTMLNEEGGIDPLEYRFYAMVDRVATTGTVWMGLTTGCAQCHTHKYDPITHTDYYSLLALLNNADEPDVVVEDTIRETQVQQTQQRIRVLEDSLIANHLPSWSQCRDGDVGDDPIPKAFLNWLKKQVRQSRTWRRIRPSAIESTMPTLTVLDDDSILGSGDVTKRDVYGLTFDLDDSWQQVSGLRLEVLPHDSLPAGGPGMGFYEGRRGDFFLSELTATHDGKPIGLQEASQSFGKISVGSGKAEAKNVIDGEGSTGWSTSGQEGQSNQWVANFENPIGPGELRVEMLFERHFAAPLGHFRFSLTGKVDGEEVAVASSLPERLRDWNVDELDEISESDFAELRRAFVQSAPELKTQRKPIDRELAAVPEVIRTLGMQERSDGDRVTHRHHRGEYLQAKETVPGAIPSLFEPLPGKADRLALARWLVSDKNPLVGRVVVNRAWREFFGTGIVNTAGDFGTQSEPPSHPDLLDWLAVDFQQQGWSLKKLHRQIVMSSTYQLAIGPAPATDPQNRLLSRFPHRRLNAETIRDAFLSAAGLLTRQVGGPSVFPPQPASVMEMAYSSPKWNTSQGGDRYRRSVYTFSKRTAPFAAFTAFDGPTGELCVARRDRSTTPLQALTLLNDAMYFEIAKGLADQAVRDVGVEATTQDVARHLFRRLLVRQPQVDELDAVVRFYETQRDHEQPWTLVARALMNTDEAITTP